MILLFPDLDTLRLALTSHTIPTDVTLAPAAVSFDDQGRAYVEPTVGLSKSTTRQLDRIGVKGSKRHATEAPEEVTNWVQILPLIREPGTPQLGSQAAVLFELQSAEELPTLVTEMLRLGNDRQSFRWFAAPDKLHAEQVLLRVIGPPYYTLLRALDRVAGGIRAYVERTPRVWVEIGYSHPFAAQVRVAEKQLLLIRQPREWLFLDDAPFQDVYNILQFKLPSVPVGWKESPTAGKMTVPLRLAAGNAADVPELWVLRDNAVEQLDTLVRDADDRLTQRLMFAVATDPAGKRTVVLRTRPSRLAAPVLPLDRALGFKPFWKLPNLFLPTGKRLHPTLRRDTVRKLLADDPDQVVWLYPDGAGGFTPESVPDGAFRSLTDWVNYVIEAEQAPLAAWIEATRFDFEHFQCQDGGPKPRPDKGDKEPRAKDDVDDPKATKGVVAKGPVKGKPAGRATNTAESLPPPAEVKRPSEWVQRRAELEVKFQAIEGPLDAPERRALWPELAVANMGVGDSTCEAAICWLNALWNTDPMPVEWLGSWVRGALPATGGTIRAEELERLLHGKGVSVNDSHALIAAFLWLAHQKPVPAWLVSRLPAIQSYLETHEGILPVRAVWLAGYRLSQLSGADVLGLARIRDRLLQRLLDKGLESERDLPGFLRYSGLKDSERLRLVRTKAMDLHQVMRKWIEHIPANLPYVDLMFAYGFGRLGESVPARKLLEDARQVMESPVPTSGDDVIKAAVVKNFLFKAFKYRVEQTIAGKPAAGQMSAELIEALDEISRKGASGSVNNPYKIVKYAIDRMRDQSRIMEPQERLDPYADWTKHGDAVKKELAELQAIHEPGKLADRIRKLYRDGVQGKATKDVQFQLLHEALPLSARVGEAFTIEMLALVPNVLAAGPSVAGVAPESQEMYKKQGELLERALMLAGHFDRSDLVRRLADQFSDLVHSKPEEARFKLINAVAGQALRSLRKLGLRDEINRFFTRLQTEALRAMKLPELRKKYLAKPEVWSAALQTQLNLAAGWLTFGLDDHAEPILLEARNELLSPAGLKLQPKDYTALARAYVAALGQGPSGKGLSLITELFHKMDPAKINNTWTTAPFYSRLHLNLVEDVILAVVSDEFALGPAGRRWLDDDEYLVRRRIHRDMRGYLEKERL